MIGKNVADLLVGMKSVHVSLLPIPGDGFVAWVEPDTAAEFLRSYQAIHGNINAVLDAEAEINKAIDAGVDAFIREHERLHGLMILDAVAPSDGPRDNPLDYRFGDYALPVDYMTVTEEEIDRILALRPPKDE